jgi:hypothetical protein
MLNTMLLRNAHFVGCDVETFVKLNHDISSLKPKQPCPTCIASQLTISLLWIVLAISTARSDFPDKFNMCANASDDLYIEWCFLPVPVQPITNTTEESFKFANLVAAVDVDVDIVGDN